MDGVLVFNIFFEFPLPANQKLGGLALCKVSEMFLLSLVDPHLPGRPLHGFIFYNQFYNPNMDLS